MHTSQTGDFDPWLLYFLEGVHSQATDAEERAVRLIDLQSSLKEEVLLQRATHTVQSLVDLLFINPYVTARQVQERLNVSAPTAQAALDWLVEQGHLTEVTGKSRGRIYFAKKLFDALYKVSMISLDE